MEASFGAIAAERILRSADSALHVLVAERLPTHLRWLDAGFSVKGVILSLAPTSVMVMPQAEAIQDLQRMHPGKGRSPRRTAQRLRWERRGGLLCLAVSELARHLGTDAAGC